MVIDARHRSKTDYRYGFNGIEKDDELKGEGNSLDFGARMYDSRVGRWFKMDPLSKKYPYDSPYIFAGNSPISIMDPDGERKRKVTLEVDQNGVIKKSSVQHIDYSLKSIMRKTGNDPISGDAIVTYDYYDTVDLVVIVKDAKGKVLSTNTQNNITGDLREKGRTFMPKSVLEASDAVDDYFMGIPVVGRDPFQGNAKGNFKGGIDFRIDDEGNILNIRGLEKVNSTANPQVVEISELYAIMAGQAGAPMPTRLSTIDRLGNGVKVMEQMENSAKAAEKVVVEMKEKYYSNNINQYSGKKSVTERVTVVKDTAINKGDQKKVNDLVNRRNEKRKNIESKKND